MTSQTSSCESPCGCCNDQHKTKLIVLTGGPGAGKTAVLEATRKLLCEHVAILPEAAGIVFRGGFWRLNSQSARMAAQRAIFHVQSEMENLVNGENKWGIGLCDRGTIDGFAYWTGTEADFWKTFNTTQEKEFSRYSAVIHLRSPSLENGYNFQNPIRVESSEEAQKIDERIHQVWRSHPNYWMIPSTKSFLEKINKAFAKIQDFVPDCCKSHFEGLREQR